MSEEYEFWKDVPSSPLERITQKLPRIHREPRERSEHHPVMRRAADDRPRAAGARQHHEITQSIPVVPAARRLRVSTQQVDPLLRRVGALAILIAICVPIAYSLRGGDSAATALQPDASTLATGSAADSSVASTAAAAAPVTEAGSTATVAPTETAATAAPQTEATTAATQAAPASSATVVAAAPPAATVPATAAKSLEAVTTLAPTCTKKYTVVAGDYWILIAKKVSVTTKELLAANNATTSTPLFPGRSVCLPANASTPTTAAPPTTAKPTTTTAAPTTTKPPTTTTKPPTTTVPVKSSYTRAEVEAIIRQIWPDDLEDEAVRIATRESNLIPTAKNYCCHGLFQIYWNVHKGWLANIGITNLNQLYDPRVNAWAALVMYYRAGGWGPWRL